MDGDACAGIICVPLALGFQDHLSPNSPNEVISGDFSRPGFLYQPNAQYYHDDPVLTGKNLAAVVEKYYRMPTSFRWLDTDVQIRGRWLLGQKREPWLPFPIILYNT